MWCASAHLNSLIALVILLDLTAWENKEKKKYIL